LQHVAHLPSVLQALQDQLAVQNEIKTSTEKTIEGLSKKLKTIV